MITLTHPLTLASNSPRRRQLLRDLRLDFTVEVRPTDESFPAHMPPQDVPAFLAQHKAQQFELDASNRLILCADTVVVVDDHILNKPQSSVEAVEMLRRLSGRTHEVVTGVCLLSSEGYDVKTDVAKVHFKPLTDQEVWFYVEHFRPFDKAGAYGIQEWIGMMGIDRIEGSFYTIMGLPVHIVYEMLTPYTLSYRL